MAFVRKRVLPSGKVRFQTCWIDKTGPTPKRVSEDFATAKMAREKRLVIEAMELSNAVSSSEPFRRLADNYLSHMQTLVDNGQRERAYFAQLKTCVNLHILSDLELADARCCSIGTPQIQRLLYRLINKIGIDRTVRVRTTLTQIFKHGARVGFVGSNPVSNTKIERTRRPDAGHEKGKFRLPSKHDLKALIDGAASFDNTGRAVALVRVAMFAGLRISEIRGLECRSCHLVGKNPKISITQRADRYEKIGRVKSRAGLRDVDLGAETAQALRVWLMKAPKPKPPPFPHLAPPIPPAPLYAFPASNGRVWSYSGFTRDLWIPLMNHCGLVTNQPAGKGTRNNCLKNANLKAPAFGIHTLRHVFASLQIEQGVTPKRLQKLLGHQTLEVTMNTYSHLWPDEDADRERARRVENLI